MSHPCAEAVMGGGVLLEKEEGRGLYLEMWLEEYSSPGNRNRSRRQIKFQEGLRTKNPAQDVSAVALWTFGARYLILCCVCVLRWG